MTSEEYLAKLNRLRWLNGIANDYKEHLKMITKEKDYFRVYGIQYAARSDPSMMDVNSNFFPVSCIEQGLVQGLLKVNTEIYALKEEIKESVVTLE